MTMSDQTEGRGRTFSAILSPVMALFAHPGHELVISTLMEKGRMEVSFLSDGSGGTATSRSDYSRALIAECGAQAGPVCGVASDRQFYDAIMRGDIGLFADIGETLVGSARAGGATALVTDPMEYFNPLHDLANTLADIIVASCAAKGQSIAKFVYPNEYPELFDETGAAVLHFLSPGERAQKEARGARYLPLEAEKARLKDMGKLRCMTVESLFDDPIRLADIPSPDETRFRTPYYEDYGRKAVAEGRYRSCLTFAGHVRPFTQRLVRHFGL